MRAMWRNYLTVGYRALTKSKTYAFINIAGLAIGLAACLMILLYVRYETSYDKWLPDADRVFQVQSIHTDPETGQVSRQQGTHGIITESLAKDFPQIEAIARAEGAEPVFLRNGEASFAPMIRADESFFRILDIPFLYGDPATALKNVDDLVLSRSEALKRFGGINVVGQTMNGFDVRIDLGPGPFVLAGGLALAIALGTIAGHALKVARANPIHALRYE